MPVKASFFDKGGIQAYLARKTERNSTEKGIDKGNNVPTLNITTTSKHLLFETEICKLILVFV